MPSSLSLLLLTLCCSLARAAPAADLITSLPGWNGPLPTRQYSGFFNISDNTKHVHYMFVESELGSSAPVVLWLNGGPGASSIGYGYFTELGPFYLSDDSIVNTTDVPQLFRNEYAWSKLAHLLFFEHPSSVGFSYCDSPCSWNDESQVDASYEALTVFLREFPEYAQNDLYIMGESYAGIYVPTLVERIYHNPANIPLRGFAVGNGCIGKDVEAAIDTPNRVEFFYGHGLYSRALYASIQATCDDLAHPNAACLALLQRMSDEIGSYYVYNIYDTCGDDQVTFMQQHQLGADGALRSAAFPSYPCGMERVTTAWMNRPDVRAALHVPDAQFYGHAWTPESPINYTRTRASLLDVYPTLLAKYRTLIYNGDVDACIPYIGNEQWTAGLGLATARPWHPWVVDKQVAGYATRYASNNFTFLTVKGAGHMVPQYKAPQALDMLRRFLNNLDYD